MTLLQEELEEWQSGKKKSEQIAQLQEEIAAMETALQGMTEVSNLLLVTITTVGSTSQKRNLVTIYLQRSLSIFYFYIFKNLCLEFITVQDGAGRKGSLVEEGTRPSEFNAARGD